MSDVATTEFVTIHDIPVLETGIEYPASTGPFTVTSDMLQSAVDSQDDPHITAPKIKISHAGNVLNEDLQSLFEAAQEAEAAIGDDAAVPALGTWTNLRVENDGQTLVADAFGVPAWLAGILETAYPARSIEGGPWPPKGVKAANDKEYSLVIWAVSLLGVVGPGCTSLDDLQTIFSEAGPTVTVIEMAHPKGGAMPVEAQANVGDIRRAFYDDFAQGDRYWWWDRELLVNPNEFIAEDDEGELWRVPFDLTEKSGDSDEITFGDPEAIKIKYVPDKNRDTAQTEAAVLLSARLPNHGTVLSVNVNPPRQSERENNGKESTVTVTQMEVDRSKLTERLGLPADATDEQVNEALGQPAPETETGGEGGEAPATPPAGEQPEGGEQPAGGDQPAGSEEPAGGETQAKVEVPAEEWERVQREAGQGAALAAQEAEKDRDRIIANAVNEGRIPPARKQHYATMWTKDPEGTKTLLTAEVNAGGLAPGTIPVSERGASPEGSGENLSNSSYPTEWLPEVAARAAGGNGGTPAITMEGA